MRKIIYPIIAFFLLGALSGQATTKKVLFIGNSYFAVNNVPSLVDSISRAFGDTLIYDASTPGGFTLEGHSTNATTIAKIFSQKWDLVVIQEQSQRPAFPPSQVAVEVYPFAARLDSMVKANDTCTQTMFMMTWGRANGDQANCASYPVICTYNGMQMRLRESYLQMAADNHAIVAPVGSAFKIMMDSTYAPWLYSSDSSHPVIAGSYLEACVLYSSIFHKSTRNCAYNAGIINTQARLLQRIATKVVFDSLNLWQSTGHYPYAGFTKTTGSSHVVFTNLSPVATKHSWLFGDGGSDTTANPSHHYATGGTYVVKHTVTTNCFTETMTDTVFAPVSVMTISKENDAVRVMQEMGGKVTFELLQNKYTKMDVLDSKGAIVRRYTIQNQLLNDVFVPGLYIYRIYTEAGNDVVIGKIGVY